MKKLRSVIALTTALAMSLLLCSCGEDNGSAGGSTNGDGLFGNELSGLSGSGSSDNGSVSKTDGTSDQGAVSTADPVSADTLPAGYNDSWKGKIRTRTILYYMDNELVDDDLTYIYEYDEKGRVDKIRLSDRNEYHQYTYDDHDNIVLFEDILNGSVAMSNKYAYEYYANGQRSRMTKFYSYSKTADGKPAVSYTITYDEQGRETEKIGYDLDGEKETDRYVFVYDDSKPRECVVNYTHTSYKDGDVDKVKESTYYCYALPDAKGQYRFDEFDLYFIYDVTTEAGFYKYYMTCTKGQTNCKYDDHGSVIDDGVQYTYSYEYNTNGMLLKAVCYNYSGSKEYEYEYDGYGNVTKNMNWMIKKYTAESLAKRKVYNNIACQYTFY